MEQEEFVSDNSDNPLMLSQCFQVDRYVKKNNYLKIPDTIPEQSSDSSLNTNTSKMEVSQELALAGKFDQSEHIAVTSDQSIRSDESSASTIIAVDNSYLIDCERKLLENSSSDEEKSSVLVNKVGHSNRLPVPRELKYFNETISTPPNELRHQIYILRDEVAETHEFHDLEIQILKEEKFFNETDNAENNYEWFEKYQTLMELYTTLKDEYEEYRKEQEKVQVELHNKTTAYLENICSQIEASDSSINFSNASLLSFNKDIKSSTMMGNISELETTIVNDKTLTVNDPLAFTQNSIFNTSQQTMHSSAKKLFPQELSSSKVKSEVEEAKSVCLEKSVEIDSEYNKLLEVETALYNKIKEVDDLELRLLKLEDMLPLLQSENERISSVILKENTSLKNTLSKKTEQLNTLTEKLITETIGLNPSLKDSLSEMHETKILSTFIDTIMESCKVMKDELKDELLKKFNYEKTVFETQRNSDLTLIENLQNQIKSFNIQNTDNENITQEYDDLKKSYAEINQRYLELEAQRKIDLEFIKNLQNQAKTMNEQMTLHENLVHENENIKLKYEELLKEQSEYKTILATREEEIRLLQLQGNNIKKVREDLAVAEESIIKLNSQLSIIENDKKQIESNYQKLEKTMIELEEQRKIDLTVIENLRNQEKSANEKICQYETILKEYDDFQQSYTNLNEQLTEVQTTLATRNEEIRILQLNENNIRKIREDLATAEESIIKLNSQLSTVENEKKQIESDYQKLEETTTELEDQRKIDLTLIENLRNQEKSANEKICEYETILKEYEDLKKSYTNLNEQLAEAKSSLAEREEEIRDLQLNENNITKTREDLNLAKESIVMLENQLSIFENEKIQMESELQKLKDTNKELEDENKVNTVSIENLENQVKLFKEQIRDHEIIVTEFANFKKESEDLCKQLAEAKSSLAEREEEIRVLQLNENNIAKTREDLNLAKESIVMLENQLSIFENEKIQMESELQKLKDTNKELEDENKVNTVLIENLENQVKLFKEQIRDHEIIVTELGNSKKENEQVIKENEDLYKELAEAKMNLTKREEEIRVLQVNEQSIIKIKENLVVAEDSVVTLRTQLSAIENEKRQIESEFQILQETIKEKEVQRESDLALIENLQNQVKLYNEKITEYENTVKEYNDFKKTYEFLQNQLTEMEPTLDTRNEETGSFQFNENNVNMGNISVAGEAISKLETQLSSLEKEKAQIEMEYQKFQETIKEKEAQRQTDLKLIENLQNQEKSYNEKINEHENILREYDDFKKKYEDLQKQFTEIETSLVTQNKDIQVLQLRDNNIKTEDFSVVESVSKLEKELLSIENEKNQIECRYEKLEKSINNFFKLNENIKEKVWELSKCLNEENCSQLVEGNHSKTDSNKEIDNLRNKPSNLCINRLEEVSPNLNELLTSIAALTALKKKYEKNQRKPENIKIESKEKNPAFYEIFCFEMDTSDRTNFNHVNLISFNTRIKDISELETENDYSSVLSVNDFLSSTQNKVNNAQQEVLRSPKKLFSTESNSVVVNKINDLSIQKNIEPDSEYSINYIESALQQKIKEVEELETRLLYLENFLPQLKNENKSHSEIIEENKSLKSLLFKKTEELHEITEKLITEITDLNPSLKDTLSEMPGSKILSTFIESIMENSKTIQDILQKKLLKKFTFEKAKFDNKLDNYPLVIETHENQLKSNTGKTTECELAEKEYEESHKQLTETQTAFAIPNEEIRSVQLNENNFVKTKEELAAAEETIIKLESQLTIMENEKNQIETDFNKLEDTIKELQIQRNTDLNLIENLQNQVKSYLEKMNEHESIFSYSHKSDLALIENLQNQVKLYNEKITEYENTVKEYNDFKKTYEFLQNQFTEMEAALAIRNEEIQSFQLKENNFVKTKEELAAAEETIIKLESQLTIMEKEKKLIETDYNKLEDTIKELQIQRNTDLDLMENLQNQVKSYVEKMNEHESILSEYNDVKSRYEDLVIQLTEAKTTLVAKDEEIRLLQLNENMTLEKAKENLAIAEESIHALKGQLSVIENEKKQIESVYQELEETTKELKAQRKIDLTVIENFENQTKSYMDQIHYQENLIKEYDDFKVKYEDLQKKFTKAETILANREEEIKLLQMNDINIGKTREDLAIAEESIIKLNSQLSIIENEKKQIESDYQKLEETTTELEVQRKIDLTVIENLRNQEKSANEKICQYETILKEYEDFKQSYTNLNEQLTEVQTILATRNEEIRILQLNDNNIKKIREDLATAEESIIKLNSQLSIIENEKKQIESDYQKLEETTTELEVQRKIDLTLIENLRNQEKSANEKICEYETILKEYEDFKKNYTNLNEQLAEAKTSLADRLEEIRVLQLNENNIIKTREDLNLAKESIVMLEYQLSIFENEKLQMESEFQKLKDTNKELEDENKVNTVSIENLENQVKLFKEQIRDHEIIVTELGNSKKENEQVIKENEDLYKELAEAKMNLTKREEEIRVLQVNEQSIIKIKENLVVAEDSVVALKTQLSDIENEKRQIESEFQILQETIKEKEVQRESDLALIENLQNQVKLYNEKITEYENTVKEYDDFKKTYEFLRNQFTEMEAALAIRNEEIQSFQLKENNFVKTKEELAAAEEIIIKLESQLTIMEKEKKLIETDFNKLEDTMKELQIQRNTDLDLMENLQNQVKSYVEKMNEHEIILSEYNDVKSRYEDLVTQLTEAKTTLVAKDEEIRLLQLNENITLEKAKENLAIAEESIHALKGQLSAIENEKKQIESVYQELEETTKELKAQRKIDLTVMESLQNQTKLYSEQINHQEYIIKEYDDFKVKYEDLQKQFTDAEFNLAARNEEIRVLQLNENDFIKTKQDLVTAEESVIKLESQITIIENEKRELEIRYHKLEETTKNVGILNEDLKHKVRELNKIISSEMNLNHLKEDLSILNNSSGVSSAVKSVSKNNLYLRRLDKLEEMNQNLTELLINILTLTEYPNLEKLNFSSVRNFSSLSKKVTNHINTFLESKNKELNDLKTTNTELDEECESYAKIIKDLKKEAAVVWKQNTEKTQTFESEISKLKETIKSLENEKEEQLTKISKLDNECQKLRNTLKEGVPPNASTCGNEFKKINDLKRTILIKEQKIVELQDLESQIVSCRSQIKYLENALDQEKKKNAVEKEKNKKLQNELNELTKNQSDTKKKTYENEMLDELRMRGSLSGGVVQEFVDKETIRKLKKDNGILKELCRARHAEIKRLEAENASLKNCTPKNLNQLDSPIHVRSYNTRSKNVMKDLNSPWKTQAKGKENRF